MKNIQITDSELIFKGESIPLANILLTDVQTVDVLFRGAIILILCLLGPIISMILGTQLNDYDHQSIRWPLTIITGPGAVIFGIVLSFIWKKPWAVVYELKDVGYRSIVSSSKEEAESLATRINKAIA